MWARWRPGIARYRWIARARGASLLSPREWRIECPSPWHRHMVVRLVRAPGVVEVLELVRQRHHHPVEHCDFVGRADESPFRAAAVVAADVDDQRVVE